MNSIAKEVEEQAGAADQAATTIGTVQKAVAEIAATLADEAKRIGAVESDATDIAAESAKIREATLRHADMIGRMSTVLAHLSNGHRTRMPRETS
jgi:methyl-accepting chemotaxis protein